MEGALPFWLAPPSAAEMQAIGLSLRVGFWSVTCSLPLALGLAWLLARGRFPGRQALDGLVHLPLVLPPVVTGYLLLLLLGANGPLGRLLEGWFGVSVMFSWTGAAVASAVMALPLMIRSMRLSIEAVDWRLVDAARTLGAGRLDAMATIALPLALPGVLAGLVLGFARSLGEFGATITFVSSIPGETATIPVAIYAALQTPGGEPAAARLSTVSVLLSVGALMVAEALHQRMARGRADAP